MDEKQRKEETTLGIVRYLIQQVAQSIINYHLSLMIPLHVSTRTRSSSAKYIKKASKY